MIRNKDHAWRVLEYQRELADAKAIANWDKEIAQWLKEQKQRADLVTNQHAGEKHGDDSSNENEH